MRPGMRYGACGTHSVPTVCLSHLDAGVPASIEASISTRYGGWSVLSKGTGWPRCWCRPVFGSLWYQPSMWARQQVGISS